MGGCKSRWLKLPKKANDLTFAVVCFGKVDEGITAHDSLGMFLDMPNAKVLLSILYQVPESHMALGQRTSVL